MKKVYETYPDDHEAAVSMRYRYSLLSRRATLLSRIAGKRQRSGKVIATEPDHPGVAHI